MIELQNAAELANQVENLLTRRNPQEIESRVLIALAGPPAAGKTTLSETLRSELEQRGKCRPVALQMDGFHHKNEWLFNHHLHRFKGRIDTFDVDGLLEKTKALKNGKTEVSWPIYSREIHAPVADGVLVKAQNDVAILEGNYLLIDAPRWSDLHDLFDLTVFVDARGNSIESRLLERHLKGGKSKDEAWLKIEETDLPNMDFVREHSVQADYLLLTS